MYIYAHAYTLIIYFLPTAAAAARETFFDPTTNDDREENDRLQIYTSQKSDLNDDLTIIIFNIVMEISDLLQQRSTRLYYDGTFFRCQNPFAIRKTQQNCYDYARSLFIFIYCGRLYSSSGGYILYISTQYHNTTDRQIPL